MLPGGEVARHAGAMRSVAGIALGAGEFALR